MFHQTCKKFFNNQTAKRFLSEKNNKKQKKEAA
jgi:hypothetical protein